MSERLYWLGNAAKTAVIDDILARTASAPAVTVFDYGCGDGGDWPRILADHARLRLIGYEPYAPSAQRARERLSDRSAQILSGDDIVRLDVSADYIVSFSVFEHVVHRADFLRHAKRILAQEGWFYLNYDDGHFRNLLDVSRPATWLPALRAWGRTALSAPLAMLGKTSHYQRRVDAADAHRLVSEAGFAIERIQYQNLACLKDLAKSIPEPVQQNYAAWWLEIEASLNERFNCETPQASLGDRINLWQQMPSRTLLLRHR
jgi:SAM-dependent methyltransferase